MTAPLEAEAVPAASGDRGSSAVAPRAAAVELRGVVKRYGDVTAVRDATLFIQEGEFFSLLGPSGCGKTTTLSLIGGFADPTRARSFIQGARLAAAPPHRRPVNTVFQSYALFPHMTVAENMPSGCEMKRTADGRDRRAGRADAGADVASTGLASAARRSSPVGSNSGWPSRAPWSTSPPCCCWTSRWDRSI